jgi:glycosyltransferase involved in cell wall biosynthesis
MSHIVIDARLVNSTSGRYIERLLHYLEQVDTTNNYTVLLVEKDVEYWKPTAKNFTVVIADFHQYSFAEQLGLKHLLDELKPDLVHFCMPQQPVLYRGKHITTFHDLSLIYTYNSDKDWLAYHIKQFVGRFVFKRVAKTSVHILVTSDYTKQDLIKFTNTPEDKITLTYESADVSNDSPVPYATPFKKYIMYVGKQSDYKNIRRLGDAHQRLIKKYPDLGLLLVGSKNASAVANEEYFTDHNYKNIVFTGFVDDAQLVWLYKNVAAYVFPSLMEGFGLPGLEAMGNGAPVVSSSATCLPEIYGDAARYFDPTSVTDMARAIDEVLDDETLRHDLIKKGFLQIKKYSWRRMAEQTHAVYLDALKEKTTNLPGQS